MATIEQTSMRIVHVSGGLGVIVSGLVWLLAALVFITFGFEFSLLAFFLGGMLIHPLSVLISNMVRPKTVLADKGLTRLALFTLPILFAGLYLAYKMSLQNPEWFYSIMAMAIGIRYMLFKLIYGMNAFIALGSILTVIGIIAFGISLPLIVVPALIGVIECLFGAFLIQNHRKNGLFK